MARRPAVIERQAPHAVDATSTKLLRPEAHYTVFGRFRFVVEDDRDDELRGFR